MAKLNPFQFIQEVRDETSKVVWPTYNETLVTTIMVLIMVVLASLFFLTVDQILGGLMNFILGVGRG